MLFGTLINVSVGDSLTDLIAYANGLLLPFQTVISWTLGFLLGGFLIILVGKKLFKHH